MTSRRVLVTGGAGYIGSHTCKALASRGYLPVTIDNLSLGHEAFVNWGPLIRADLRETQAVVDAIQSNQVEAVVHFAASAYVGESVLDPAKYYQNNVIGTLSLLEGMRAAGLGNIVFSSTCAVYGQPTTLPITEETHPSPVNPYGRTKLVCEKILEDYSGAYGLNAVRLRYFNASGADPDGELGELRDPETHLIPRALMSLQGWIPDFRIFGSDFPTPDGTAIRDYIHVADLAEAHVLAVERLLKGAGGDVFNLGTGHGCSIGQVLQSIERITGHRVPAPMGARRPGDPAELVADCSKSRSRLGFTPALSDLDTIIATAWKWHQKAHPRRQDTTSALFRQRGVSLDMAALRRT